MKKNNNFGKMLGMNDRNKIKSSQGMISQAVKRALMPILLILLLPIYLHSYTHQHAHAYPYPPEDDILAFFHLSIKDGLSQNTVTAVMQDKKGFMWIGTQDGLNRYDAHEFILHKFSADDPNTLSDDYINVLYEDRRGKIWIGTQNGGLNRFDPSIERFSRFQHQPGNHKSLSHNRVLTIYEDSRGLLWVGTLDGLNRFDRSTGTFLHYRNNPENPNSLSHNDVRSIMEDLEGNLWIGTYGGGLNRLNPSTHTFTRYQKSRDNPNSLTDNRVNSICFDRSGNLYIGTYNGFTCFNPITGVFTRYQDPPGTPNSLADNEIAVIYPETSVSEYEYEYIWIGTHIGLHRFNCKTKKITGYPNISNMPYSLGNNLVNSIYKDRAGELWIGISGDGLYRTNRTNQFKNFRKETETPNSLSDSDINAIFQDHRGILWIGTEVGLNRFDRDDHRFTHYLHRPGDLHSLSGNEVSSICEDHKGVLWIGTRDGGLNRYDMHNSRFIHYQHKPGNPNSLSIDDVICLYEDHTGVLWIGTQEGGLNSLDAERKHFSLYKHNPNVPSSISSNNISIIYEDRGGVLWIGTEQSGLNRFNRATQQFTRYKYNPQDPNSISHDYIMCIYEEGRGVLWIGTEGGGINRFDVLRNRFFPFTVKDGLPSNVVLGILEDHEGNLWLSTNRGLSRFNPKTKQFKNYDWTDGVQGNEFNRRAFYKNKNGEMFFGGVNGFNAFYPKNIKDNPYIPPVVITDFQLFNKSVPIGERADGRTILKKTITETEAIKLTHKDYIFSFQFAALNYISPKKRRYAYIMEGFEKEWNYVEKRYFAAYNNLPPGEYTFKVKVSNNDGRRNEEGTSLKLIISPPFWQTWWFRLLGIMAISFLILTVYKIRTYNIRKRSKQLEEINAALNIQITERKMLEEQLVRQEKLAVLGQLAGGVGHELRNPLGAIKNSAYFLNMVLEEPTPEVKETLEILEKEVITSEGIISSLLDFARSRPPLKRKVNINDIIREKVSRINVPENIEVKSQIDEFIPFIMADPDQLDQIFGNILLNAIQAMPEGGQLTIKSEAPGQDRVAVSITDTGVGIPGEDLEKIFEPLFTSKAKGIGLGMAITKTFVEGHGGTIEVQSETGKGSTFTVRLPIGKKEEKQHGRES